MKVMDTRSLPVGLLALTALLCGAAQVPSQIQQQNAYLDILSQGNKLTPAAAQDLEDHLRGNPEDLPARGKLTAYYYVNLLREPWLKQVFWLIEHHPESEVAGFNFAGITALPNLMNDEADSAHAKDLWLEQTNRHPNDPHVLANALKFFCQPGSDAAIRERLLKRAAELHVSPPAATQAEAAPGVVGSVPRQLAIGVIAREPLRAPAPPMSAPPSGDTPVRIRVGGNVQAANLIRRVEPVYPPPARQEKTQGLVRFTAIIAKDGRVDNLQLVSGHPLLVPAALEAVRQWIYRPTLLNGAPVEVITQIDVPFTLPGDP